MTLATERQQFEEWFKDSYHLAEEHLSLGEFGSDMAQTSWKAWQASRELLANREAQPVMWAHERKLSTDVAITKDEVVAAAWKSEGLSVTPLYTAPPAPANAQPVAWEMRYWNNGYNMWGDWERITAEQHAEMSVQHAESNDYEFRVLYTAPPAPAVPDELRNAYKAEGIAEVLKDAKEYAPLTAEQWGTLVKNWHQTFVGLSGDANACRAAMLAQPVSSGYKLPPHLYRELVNSLRDTAVRFSGTEQLRERLNTALSQFIEPDHPHTRTVAPEGGNG